MPDDADIFARGWSTKPGSRGIGLALVRQTVRRHGGEVTVGAADDGGAEFTVRLPLHQNDQAEGAPV